MGRQTILGMVMAVSLLAGSARIAGAQETPPEPTAPAPAPAAEAFRFTLTGGRVVEGARLAEDATYYTVDSFTDGLVRVRKTDVARLERLRETGDEDDFVDEVASRPSPGGRHHRPRHHRSRRHRSERPDPYDDEHFIDEVASLPPPCDGRCPGPDWDSGAALGGGGEIGELVARGFVAVIFAFVSGGHQ